jgi:hypothetical protein
VHQVGFTYTIVLSVLSLKFKEIIYVQNLISYYREVTPCPVTNTNGLMVLIQIIAVYSVNYGQHKNKKCEHYTKRLHFKRGGVFIYHSSSTL